LLNKITVLLTVLFTFSTILDAEIIHNSKLLKKNKPFKISRDLFNPKENTKPFIDKKSLEKKENIKIKEEKLKFKHQELFDNIIYEGYILKSIVKTALLNINGEYITCKIGDTILDKIIIKDITKEEVKIMIDNKKYNIKIKGDENEQ